MIGSILIITALLLAGAVTATRMERAERRREQHIRELRERTEMMLWTR